jgi:hypothetical protein
MGSEAGDLECNTQCVSFEPLGCARQRKTVRVLFTPYLVAQALRGNDGNFIANALVRLEVKGELGVVPLDDDLGGLLNGFCANATHFDGWAEVVVFVVRSVVGCR